MLRTIGIIGLLGLAFLVAGIFAGMPHGFHEATFAMPDGSYEIYQFDQTPWAWVLVPLILLGVGLLVAAILAGAGLLLVLTLIFVACVVLFALLPVLIPVVLILSLPFLAIYGLVKLLS
jgi:hypothetical protein